MKGLRYITSSFAALILALSGAAQSRAYAKFDGNGEIIGLFNLGNSEARCRETRTMSGITRNVKAELRNTEMIFSFTLVSFDRSYVIRFSMKQDTFSRADIEDLLSNKRHSRVRVRACQNGDRGTVEEITRL